MIDGSGNVARTIRSDAPLIGRESSADVVIIGRNSIDVTFINDRTSVADVFTTFELPFGELPVVVREEQPWFDSLTGRFINPGFTLLQDLLQGLLHGVVSSSPLGIQRPVSAWPFLWSQ